MHRGYKIVSVTPAGRKRYLEILYPLLQRQSVIDEIQMWCNTENAEDLEYIHSLPVNARPLTIPYNGNLSIHSFFPACVEPDTIYVRFDDDVCYIATDALESLLDYRIDHPEYFLVFANIVNNCVLSHIHQRLGLIPLHRGFAEYDCMGNVGWRSGEFAQLVHESFLRGAENGSSWLDWKFREWVLYEHQRVSINCVSWFGSEFAKFSGRVDPDEEPWLAERYPREIGKMNAICGDAVVAHFAFGTQRDYLESNTDLLVRYRELV